MQGRRIAGAVITARQNSQDIKAVHASDKGEFSMTLQPGVYNIVVDAQGYSTGVKSNVEVRSGKTVDLGDRLIMQVDRGTRVMVRGSVFYKDGTSVPGADIDVERINADGSKKKMASMTTDIAGEFGFSQPEGAATFRITARLKDASVSKDITVDSPAIYRIALNLNINRKP